MQSRTRWEVSGAWIVVAVSGVATALLLGAATAPAQEDDGGCVYDRRIYPDGYEMCQGGQLMRCEDGAWGDIGMCDDPEPGPPPRTGGGDVELR